MLSSSPILPPVNSSLFPPDCEDIQHDKQIHCETNCPSTHSALWREGRRRMDIKKGKTKRLSFWKEQLTAGYKNKRLSLGFHWQLLDKFFFGTMFVHGCLGPDVSGCQTFAWVLCPDADLSTGNLKSRIALAKYLFCDPHESQQVREQFPIIYKAKTMPHVLLHEAPPVPHPPPQP